MNNESESSVKLVVEARGELEIVMTRAFDAPRELVFDALTKPNMVSRWMLGPPGWTMPTCDIDLKVGGTFRYVWQSPEEIEMGMGGAYREIVRPERIVNVETFDEECAGGETLVTTVFTEENATTLLATTVRYSSRKARDAAFESPMADGLGQSYDKLDALLAECAK